MLDSKTYTIVHPELRPFVQYILFNKTDRPGARATSFSNTNICLGILKDSKLTKMNGSTLVNESKSGIHSYISGMYLEPHHFMSKEALDEICIDFTPVGFYKFFGFQAKRYILNEDVIAEGFGNNSKFFFESVFAQNNHHVRGAMIERYLLTAMKESKVDFLQRSIDAMNDYCHQSVKNIVEHLSCSERKLQRNFYGAFEITPKQYMRITRFRNVMSAIRDIDRQQNFTSVAYQNGFTDQSHLVKEIRQFTHQTPKQLVKSLYNIDDKVMVAV